MATPRLINDDARFRELVWPHLAGLLRVALILTRHQQDAEDLVQETVLKAFRAVDRFQSGTSMRAWLLTILRRTQIDRARAAGRQVHAVSLDAGSLPEPESAGAEAESAEALAAIPEEVLEQFGDHRIIAALRELPEEVRWTLLLVDVQQLEHAQAAEILGVPVGTIKSRAHRGRGMLRGLLTDAAMDPRFGPGRPGLNRAVVGGRSAC